MSMVLETRLGTKMVTHHDVPRFRALRRDKTLTPAELTISNNSDYNECSLICLRGRRRGPLVTALSLLSLSGWKCNNYGVVVPHAGGIPWVLIGRTQGIKVNTYTRSQQSVSDLLGPSARLTRGRSAARHTALCRVM